jgi:hypothetical protein
MGDSVERFPSQYRVHIECLEENQRLTKDYLDCIPFDETWQDGVAPEFLKLKYSIKAKEVQG